MRRVAGASRLQVPAIDLGGFLSCDPQAVSNASGLVNEACKKQGFFFVVNHGIDTKFIAKAHNFMDNFFRMHISEKQRTQRRIGDNCGYASSFPSRFSSKLP
jgi:gibberellin 20-oxidase